MVYLWYLTQEALFLCVFVPVIANRLFRVLSGRGRYKFYGARGKACVFAEIHTGGAVNMRVKITLACSECKQRNYDTKKNKKNDPDRLELNKYCRFCRKHTLHRETK